jgi:hypothetical protein
MKAKLISIGNASCLFVSVLFLLFIIFFSRTAVSAQDEEFHSLKFYLHPALVSGLTPEQLNGRLTLYAEDLNTIFAQTNHRFLFDPATGIIITDTQPYQPYGTPPFPTSGFDVWIHAQLSDYIVNGLPHSYGGNGAFDGITGAGVAANLRWDAVHDRSALADGSRNMEEYWIQIDHIAHEFAHVFGAGVSEYYGLAQINDTTGVPPLQNVNSFNVNDPYWQEHPDYFTDPLLGNIWDRAAVGSPTGYEDLMNTIHFAEVSVAVINSPCRVGNLDCLPTTIPDMSDAKVRVIDALTGKSISDAEVNVWNIRSASPYSTTLLTDATTDAVGEAPFTWNAGSPITWFGNFSHMKLFKSFAPGYQPAVTYVSIFDAQERKMVHGLDDMVVLLYMWPDTVFAAPDAATCGSWTPCYHGSASIQEALNAAPENGRVMVLGEHTVSSSLQSGGGGTNRAALDGRYGGVITWSGGAGHLFAAESGALTVTGLSLQCQGDCTNSTAFHQNGGELLAYANNLIGFNRGYTGSGSANLRHNWWGAAASSAHIGQNDAYDFRLGASVIDWDTFTLGEAKMRGLNSGGIGVVVSHGRGVAQAPFGAATSEDGSSQCSDYYDYFTVNGSGEWLVQVPIDAAPAGCTAVHATGLLFGFAQTAGGAPDTSCTAGGCWLPFDQTVSLNRPHNVRVRLDVAALQGAPIVAANEAGNDPTAVSLNSLSAHTTLPTIGAFMLICGLLLPGIALRLRRRPAGRRQGGPYS